MKSSVRVALSTLLALGTIAAAQARPVVIENVSSFTKPDSSYTSFGVDVAIDGDYAIATASRRVADSGNEFPPTIFHTAFLYRRSGTSWTLVRRLDEYQEDPDIRIPLAVAMQDGVAVVQTVRSDFYELGVAGWTRTASFSNDLTAPGSELAIDNGRVLSGEGNCSWDGRVYARNSAGAWAVEDVLPGATRASGCDDDSRGGPVDISGSWAVVHQPNAQDVPAPTTYIYNFSGGWFLYAEALPEADVTTFGPHVAIRGTDVIVGGGNETGTLVYREEPFFGFHLADRIRPVDSFMGAGRSGGFAKSAEFLLQSSFSYDRNAGIVNVFRQRADQGYEHVAQLVGRNGDSLGSSISISGRRVLVGNGATGLVHYFELPANLTTPALVQDTFSTGNGTGWTPTAGSTFTAVQSGVSRVLRQADVAAEARTVNAVDWTNQSIEVDVRPRRFGATGAGFGLATRYQSPQNFYDVVVRNNGTVQLRRMASGTLVVRATASFTPVVNRTYRLRLQSVGTQHRVYIDGNLLLDVDSTGPTHGHPVLTTDRTAADFDNVVLSPSSHTTISANDFENGSTGSWTHSGVGFWLLWPGASTVYFQSSIAGDVRASIGVPTNDQIVRVRARPNTFATATGSQERWFGVMARHVDERNYYYLSLRSSNTVSLRKLVDGIATTLATTSLTVSPGTWYALRLDAVGNNLRAYVNGALLLEATDSAHPAGTSGPVMFKAAVDYDDFAAIQP